jgi:pSer/pThr/pTyr-binding forkhead associated (FHA) protein
MTNNNGGVSGPPHEVIVQLLDPTYRRPVKTWTFLGHTTITIGREAERDVEVSDPYVSRLHAELLLKDDAWILVSRGRNGVIVNARPITELSVGSDVVFRLGAAGPSLRFSTGANADESSSTLCFDTETIPVAIVDKTKLREDVGEITSGDYFQKLQQKVEELRRQRRGP